MRSSFDAIDGYVTIVIQMKDPIETAELLSFTRTIESKSLSKAASELGVPRATVSRRLMRLEERLQVRLLKRTTRRLAVTDAGEAFYAHAKRVLEAVNLAESSVTQSQSGVRGELRVAMPPLSGGKLRERVAEFAARHPDVRLSIQFSSAYVDLLSGAYDVALRASLRLEPGLVAKTVGRSRLLCVASPAYLAANGTPKTAADLKRHRCLMGFARGEVPEIEWPLPTGSRVRLQGSFFSNDIEMLREAARAGLGIALLPDVVLYEDIERGTLVPLLLDVVGADSRISIVYAEREFIPPQVRAFIDELSGWATELGPPPGTMRCPETEVKSAKPRRKRRASSRGASREAARKPATRARPQPKR